MLFHWWIDAFFLALACLVTWSLPGRGELRGHLNRLIAMTLCGLWHGAAWHFAAWGLYHGIGLSAYRGYQSVRRRRQPDWRPSRRPTRRVLATVATFHFVCVGWVLFVVDFATARLVIPRLLGFTT